MTRGHMTVAYLVDLKLMYLVDLKLMYLVDLKLRKADVKHMGWQQHEADQHNVQWHCSCQEAGQ